MDKGGPYIPIISMTWTFDGHEAYFLRDDLESELCDYERYSLFRKSPYQRLHVLATPLGKAIRDTAVLIQVDQLERLIEGIKKKHPRLFDTG